MNPLDLIGLGQSLGGLFWNLTSKRPEYKIPQSARAALNLAKIQAADPNAPGEQTAVDRANLTASNAIRASQEGGNALENIAAIAGNQDRTLGDISARSAADQKNDLRNLQASQSDMAGYEDLLFQMNQFAPYAERQQESRDIFGAGLQNLFGSMNAGNVNAALNPKTETPFSFPNAKPGATEIIDNFSGISDPYGSGNMLQNGYGSAVSSDVPATGLPLPGIKPVGAGTPPTLSAPQMKQLQSQFQPQEWQTVAKLLSMLNRFK